MNPFVESIKRLYLSGSVTEDRVEALCKSGKITEVEKQYILAH